MLLADIGQDFLITEVFVIEVGDFAVEAIDVIQVEFAGRQGLASLVPDDPPPPVSADIADWAGDPADT